MLNINMAFRPHTTTVSFTIATNATSVFTLNTLIFCEVQHSAQNMFINMVHDSDYDDAFLRFKDIDLYISEMHDLNSEITIHTIHSVKCYFICRCNHPIVQTKEKYQTGTDDTAKCFWLTPHAMEATPSHIAITTMNAITHSDTLTIVPYL